LVSTLKLNYLLIPLFVVITASAASYFEDVGMAWYKTINLPEWTPSNSLTVLVWTIIFVLTSLSVLIIWNKYSTEKNFGLIILLFSFNAILIVGWNILFFTQKQIGLALFQAMLLVVDLGLLIVLIWRFCPLAACLLFPYFLWVGFTTALTYSVWIIN